MLPNTLVRSRRHNWRRIGATQYVTGFTFGQLLMAFIWAPYMKLIMPYESPARSMLIWFRWFFVQIFLFAIALELVTQMTALEIYLQIFQDNTTIGWGNSAPETWLRALVETPFAIWGIGLFGLLITALIDLKIYTSEQRRIGAMPNPTSGGVVVINFPGSVRARELVRQLRAEQTDLPITFVAEELEELPPSLRGLPGVEFVRCSTIHKDSLRDAAKVCDAGSVLVFPKDPDSADTDATTETTVKRLWQLGGNAHIVYYLVGEENRDLFEFPAQSGRRRPTSVVLHMATLMVAQELLHPGFASLMQRFTREDLGATPDVLTYPANGPFEDWGALQVSLIAYSRSKQLAVNAYGFLRGDETHECPAAFMVLEPGDRVLLAVHDDFSWSDFLNAA